MLFVSKKALVVRCMKSRGHQSCSGQNINQITPSGPGSALEDAGARHWSSWAQADRAGVVSVRRD